MRTVAKGIDQQNENEFTANPIEQEQTKVKPARKPRVSKRNPAPLSDSELSPETVAAFEAEVDFSDVPENESHVDPKDQEVKEFSEAATEPELVVDPELESQEAADQAEEALSGSSKEPEAKSAKKPKRSLFAALVSGVAAFFGGLFRRKKRLEPIVEAAPPLTEEQKRTLLSMRLQELSEEQAKAEEFSAAADAKQDLIQSIDSTILDVESWVQKLERSYFWKAQQKMEGFLSKAKSDIAEYEGLVRSLALPEKGTLKKLRQTFHKGLMITTGIALVPVFLLYFIPWFARVDLFSWLLGALRSPWFIAGVAIVTAVVIGFRLLLIKLLGKKKKEKTANKKGRFSLPALVALIPLAIYGLYRIKEWLLIIVVPIIEDIRPLSLLIIGILFVFALLTLLIGYYQGWSVFRRQVTEEFARLDNVVQGYVKTKQELSRLEFLYVQTEEWMKILAHTLYRPWKIHPDWKTSNQLQTSSESFPMALRVAQAVETDPAQTAQLQRLIARRLLTQGWRSEAFDRSLSQIGRALGYEDSKISPELLDADLPHQPNNSRKLVLKYFEHSAQTAADGYLDLEGPASFEENKRPRPSDAYLLEVARAQLTELIESTQGAALSEARPSVQQIVRNPLAELVTTDLESASDIEVSDWDNFLSDALGVEEILQPPLGVLSFSEEGLKSKSGDSPTSKVLVPERFAESVPLSNSDSLEVVSILGNQVFKAAEIIVRMDVSAPLPFHHVALIQKAGQAPVRPASVEEANDDL